VKTVFAGAQFAFAFKGYGAAERGAIGLREGADKNTDEDEDKVSDSV